MATGFLCYARHSQGMGWSVSTIELITEMAFPLWTSREILCWRKAPALASLFASPIFRPRAFRNSWVDLPNTPIVSVAIGWNMNRSVKPLYLDLFRSSARLATKPAFCAAPFLYDDARVSQTVTSQVSERPCDHGASVTPSGRMEESELKPRGSW